MPAGVVAVIAVVVAGFLVIRWYTTPQPPPAPSVDVTQQIVYTITGLPASEFDAIGQGSASNRIKPVSGTLLTGASGKPEVFYYGAEYCPYCAAERWPLIIALSRFGTFAGLQTTTSSSTDSYPNTPTFTFRSATYASQYIDFRSVETYDRNQNPLQAPTPAEQQLVSKYDTTKSIPFVDFGNRYAFAGAMYLPDVLAGSNWQSIADNLQSADSAQAKAIIGSANLITAAVCKLTADQPTAVCSSATIQSLESKLG
jgi:thiol-disulfide isomerase/thioredoxin